MHKTSDTLDGESGLDTHGLFSLCKPTQVIAKELLYTIDHKRQADRRLPVLGGGKWPGRPELAGTVPEERGWPVKRESSMAKHSGPPGLAQWRASSRRPSQGHLLEKAAWAVGQAGGASGPQNDQSTCVCTSLPPGLVRRSPGDRDMPCQHVRVSPGSRRSWCSRSASGWRKR